MVTILQRLNAQAPFNLSAREFLPSMAPVTTNNRSIFPVPGGEEVLIEYDYALLEFGHPIQSVELRKGDRLLVKEGKVEVTRTYG